MAAHLSLTCMKLKATSDFKKAAKGIVLFALAAIVAFPVLHLVKGDFCWSDTLINAGLMIGLALVIGTFYFFGMQIPEKKDSKVQDS